MKATDLAEAIGKARPDRLPSLEVWQRTLQAAQAAAAAAPHLSYPKGPVGDSNVKLLSALIDMARTLERER